MPARLNEAAPPRLRVLFLTLYPEAAASSRVRVAQFLPHLREQGIACDVAAPMSEDEWRARTGPGRGHRAWRYHWLELRRRVPHCLRARRYGLVFLQKALATAYLRGMDSLFLRCAPRYVFDIDDAVHLRAPQPLRPPWSRLEDPRQIHRLMIGARRVLAGNAWLAQTARDAGAEAHVLPTCVDTSRFHPASSTPPGFRAGWIGGPATTPALAIARAALEPLGPDAVLIGADPARVPWSGARLAEWRRDTEARDLRDLHVGVMPLPKDEWSLGKCAYKALLYMATGLPCIATPHGAVQEIIRHGENGLFADSPEEWRAALERLRDPAERARIGAAARETAVHDYSLERWAPVLRGHLLAASDADS